MQLLTAEIKARLKQAVADGEKPADQTPIIVKLFTPWAGASWWVTEAEELEDGDWTAGCFRSRRPSTMCWRRTSLSRAKTTRLKVLEAFDQLRQPLA